MSGRVPARRTAPGVAAILAAAILAAAVLASAHCGKGASTNTTEHPNVLLLVMDTTRADRCAFNGYGRPTTPRLSEFAKDATVFTDAWTPANWTAPAHASLFTGLGPDRHGLNGDSRPTLSSGHATIAESFASAGYDTACFTNNEFVSPEFGLTRGFSKFEALYKDETRPYPSAKATHAAAATWAEASHAAGRPFFLFINDVEPHQPFTPPAEQAERFLQNSPTAAEIAEAGAFRDVLRLKFDLGGENIDARRLALYSDLYDAEIATLDREIGVLLDRLAKDGLLDSTVVAIVGDHGEYLGEHHYIDHAIGLYRQVLQVPLVLRYPGSFDGGRVVGNVVRLEDLAPTLTELCGLAPLPDIEGLSLTRELEGRVARGMQPPHNTLCVRAEKNFPTADFSKLARGIRSAFDGRFHLLSFSDGTVELYDVAHDPDERENVAAREPAEVARLTPLLVAPR